MIRMVEIALLAALAACASSESVTLRDPNTGQIATCGPYTAYGRLGGAQSEARLQLQDCVTSYQLQGWVRQP